jgi:hypothetical protein
MRLVENLWLWKTFYPPLSILSTNPFNQPFPNYIRISGLNAGFTIDKFAENAI